MKTLLKGQAVMVNLPHKRFEGVVVSNSSSKYVQVKHDNFKSEVFENEQCWIID